MNVKEDLVLEDVDDISYQNSNDEICPNGNDEHETSKNINPTDSDLLNDTSQFLETILEQTPQDDEEDEDVDEEQRKQEMLKIMELDFPEFKLKSDEFFQNITTEWYDPQCCEGIKEVQRLNRILSEKIEKEKEVKRQGILLRQKLYKELLSIKQQGRQEQQEERANTEKFLALTFLPVKKRVKDEHPEIDTEQKPDSIDSVFQTELEECDAIPKSNEKNSIPELDLSNSETSDSCQQRNSLRDMLDENGSYQHEAKHKTKKNFLKRNIQLAKDANSAVAMTANEKKRIELLLQDLDAVQDCDQDTESNYSWTNSSICPQGEGFTSNRGDKVLLSLIDSKLKTLMSEDEFKSVASTQRSESTQRAFTSVVPPSGTEALRTFGEKFLFDSKEERAMKEKLKKIDRDIMAIYNDPLPDPSIKLDETVLLELLESCASSMSGTLSNPYLTPKSNRSAISDVEALPEPYIQDAFPESECGDDPPRSQSISSNLALLMESPPYLSEEVLQRLLEDAIPRSSRLSTPQSTISSKSGAEEENKENSEVSDFVWPGEFYYTTEKTSLNSSLQEHFLPEISSSRSLIEADNTL